MRKAMGHLCVCNITQFAGLFVLQKTHGVGNSLLDVSSVKINSPLLQQRFIGANTCRRAERSRIQLLFVQLKV